VITDQAEIEWQKKIDDRTSEWIKSFAFPSEMTAPCGTVFLVRSMSIQLSEDGCPEFYFSGFVKPKATRP
jgi:hypothetical protein